jgi:hypothetical protein
MSLKQRKMDFGSISQFILIGMMVFMGISMAVGNSAPLEVSAQGDDGEWFVGNPIPITQSFPIEFMPLDWTERKSENIGNWFWDGETGSNTYRTIYKEKVNKSVSQYVIYEWLFNAPNVGKLNGSWLVRWQPDVGANFTRVFMNQFIMDTETWDASAAGWACHCYGLGQSWTNATWNNAYGGYWQMGFDVEFDVNFHQISASNTIGLEFQWYTQNATGLNLGTELSLGEQYYGNHSLVFQRSKVRFYPDPVNYDKAPDVISLGNGSFLNRLTLPTNFRSNFTFSLPFAADNQSVVISPNANLSIVDNEVTIFNTVQGYNYEISWISEGDYEQNYDLKLIYYDDEQIFEFDSFRTYIDGERLYSELYQFEGYPASFNLTITDLFGNQLYYNATEGYEAFKEIHLTVNSVKIVNSQNYPVYFVLNQSVWNISAFILSGEIIELELFTGNYTFKFGYSTVSDNNFSIFNDDFIVVQFNDEINRDTAFQITNTSIYDVYDRVRILEDLILQDEVVTFTEVNDNYFTVTEPEILLVENTVVDSELHAEVLEKTDQVSSMVVLLLVGVAGLGAVVVYRTARSVDESLDKKIADWMDYQS